MLTPFNRSKVVLGLFLVAAAFVLAPIARAQDAGERQAPKMSSTEYLQKLRYAQIYEEQRDATNAARLYGELYTVNPNDVSVFEGYIRALVSLRQYDDAERIINQRLKVDASLDMLLLSAKIEAWRNNRSASLDEFHKAEQKVNAKDCASLFPIVYAMMDVSYNQDALELLDQMRKTSSSDNELCSSQIAGLYLRLGQFDRASKEFIQILKAGEGNVNMVEQRLAEYLTDSLSRQTVLGALEREVISADDPEQGGPTRANLRLLAWLYGEEKDYSKALATIIQLDDINKGQQTNEGPELLQFADRARSEGALEVAAKAYAEASRRLKANNIEGYYTAQAELGALKTWESYFANAPTKKDSIATLVLQYEDFAANSGIIELGTDALLHAGNLSYSVLFDLPRATKDYQVVISHSHTGFNDATREAWFRLVDIAYANQDFALASSRLQQIEDITTSSRVQNPQDLHDHMLYERALGFYYQAKFDTAATLLNEVASDAASDYSNDAIQLSGIIETGNTPTTLHALTLFATANLDDHAHRYNEAESAYRAIIDSELNSQLSDQAALHSAQTLVALGRPNDAVRELDSMQVKMIASPLLDVAAFREAEITEQDLHDKARAQKLYEDFLQRYPNSTFLAEARNRARKLRGDAF